MSASIKATLLVRIVFSAGPDNRAALHGVAVNAGHVGSAQIDRVLSGWR
jgi:hypothetical protein